ncbi:MAG: hypothetical protein IJF67_04895 [Clostridia bacterium]|nr:hypothetical protein [Clostridia bacterium]
MMDNFKQTTAALQSDVTRISNLLARLRPAAIDDYLCEIESLCVRSRVLLDGYNRAHVVSECHSGDALTKIAGSIEVTPEGWLHITLNTLLPNCRRRVSSYIGDTICRLMDGCTDELPYFDRAFLAIVEYCNYEKHNALDNDNKGWKMIPNALKGRVIADDSQFILSVGLFAKLADDARCEIYVLPPEDGAEFMEMLASDAI